MVGVFRGLEVWGLGVQLGFRVWGLGLHPIT